MQEGYNNIQKEYRKKFLELLSELEDNYDQNVNQKLIDKVSRLAVDFAKDGLLLKKDLNEIKQELDQISSWLASETKDLLDENIVKSIELSIEGQDNATRWYLNKLAEEDNSLRNVVDKALTSGGNGNSILISVRYGTGLIEEIRDQVWNHRWNDGYKLSERIWNFKENSFKMMKDTVEKNINQGKSAVDFAKELLSKFEGTTKYQAMRLARSETNQAYHRAQHMSAEESTIVKAVKWNLSGSHPKYTAPSYRYKGYPEICDYRAKHNHHGLGPGIYPAIANKIPFDHAGGLCYKTDVLYRGEELIDKLKEKYGD